MIDHTCIIKFEKKYQSKPTYIYQIIRADNILITDEKIDFLFRSRKQCASTMMMYYLCKDVRGRQNSNHLPIIPKLSLHFSFGHVTYQFEFCTLDLFAILYAHFAYYIYSNKKGQFTLYSCTFHFCSCYYIDEEIPKKNIHSSCFCLVNYMYLLRNYYSIANF